MPNKFQSMHFPQATREIISSMAVPPFTCPRKSTAAGNSTSKLKSSYCLFGLCLIENSAFFTTWTIFFCRFAGLVGLWHVVWCLPFVAIAELQFGRSRCAEISRTASVVVAFQCPDLLTPDGPGVLPLRCPMPTGMKWLMLILMWVAIDVGVHVALEVSCCLGVDNGQCSYASATVVEMVLTPRKYSIVAGLGAVALGSEDEVHLELEPACVSGAEPVLPTFDVFLCVAFCEGPPVWCNEVRMPMDDVACCPGQGIMVLFSTGF
ncbi:hypothetical protein Nepgr_027209 [Nepenthes gracilis]|uniref:Uncharacterized protein n=1 Tax=Nepenthes gracilis TaxID=150966 RepID=A0AAD3Y3B6_NEPGR|nr:hypothetical protein Nepgr_027209 [Nepenthes gracilis]